MATLYSGLADFYDTLSIKGLGKNYAEEANYVATLARVGVPNAKTLLDVACGTGLHLNEFSAKHGFDCTGLDKSEEMLDVARARLADISFRQGDMIDFDLGKQFDIVTCLYAAIGHVNTVDNLNRAVESMAKHVKPGGMLIVEPFLQPERIRANSWSNIAKTDDGVQLVEVGRSWVQDDVLQYEAEYLIGSLDGIEHRNIRMSIGFFSWSQLNDAFVAAGLRDVVIDEIGIWENKGLIMGRK